MNVMAVEKPKMSKVLSILNFHIANKESNEKNYGFRSDFKFRDREKKNSKQ